MTKPTATLLILFSVSALAGACASTAPPVPTVQRVYSPAAVRRIMTMRANGESLSAVAREVGGTRSDVRAVERQELAQRRAPGTMRLAREGR